MPATLVLVVIGVTDPEYELATQSVWPSLESTTANGALPTDDRRRDRPRGEVHRHHRGTDRAGLTCTTAPARLTHAVVPSGEMAMPCGPAPTVIGASGLSVTRSIGVIVVPIGACRHR